MDNLEKVELVELLRKYQYMTGSYCNDHSEKSEAELADIGRQSFFAGEIIEFITKDW